MPERTSSFRPVKSVMLLKLTTPDMASEPYTADAPPVMVSTPERMNCGIRLTSTTAFALDNGKRRPSSNTRFRVSPRPRRLSEARPASATAPTVLDVWPCTNCGNWFIACSILTVPLCAMASSPTVTMGLVDEKSERAMREPVTTISSTSTASALVAGGVCPSADVLAIDAITQAVFETTGLRIVITSPPKY